MQWKKYLNFDNSYYLILLFSVWFGLNFVRQGVPMQSSGCPRTHFVDPVSLELTEIYMHMPPECWDLRCASPHSVYLLFKFQQLLSLHLKALLTVVTADSINIIFASELKKCLAKLFFYQMSVVEIYFLSCLNLHLNIFYSVNPEYEGHMFNSLNNIIIPCTSLLKHNEENYWPRRHCLGAQDILLP